MKIFTLRNKKHYASSFFIILSLSTSLVHLSEQIYMAAPFDDTNGRGLLQTMFPSYYDIIYNRVYQR